MTRNPKTLWELFVALLSELCVYLGLTLVVGVLAFSAGYLTGKHELAVLKLAEKVVEAQCGSCKLLGKGKGK